MKLILLFIFLSPFSSFFVFGQDNAFFKEGSVRVVQLVRQENTTRRYPDALPSLLKMLNEQSTARFDIDPLFITNLTDERLLENPILYVNCDEQPNLEFSPKREML